MSEYVIRNCIDWNESELAKAERDSVIGRLVIPASATKRIYIDGKAKTVRLSETEYRAVRAKDAARYAGNIEHLRGLLA